MLPTRLLYQNVIRLPGDVVSISCDPVDDLSCVKVVFFFFDTLKLDNPRSRGGT